MVNIISNRDKDGNFINAAAAWTPEKIEELLKKYNPKGTFHYHEENKEEKKGEK